MTAEPAEPTPARPPRWHGWLAAASAVLPTLHRFRNGFVWDDLHVIVRGTAIHDWRNLPAIWAHRTMFSAAGEAAAAPTPVDTWRPLTMSTFVLDAAAGGRAPWPYHLTNLLLHLACTLLVLSVARALLGASRARFALWSAVLFAVAPLCGEAHVWINGRSDPLCTALGLGALCLTLRALRSTRPLALDIGAGALFLLGLLSKEVLLGVVPAVLLLPGVPSWRARFSRTAPYALASLAYLVARRAVLGGVRVGDSGAQLGYAVARLPLLWLSALRETFVPSRVYLHSMLEDFGPVGPAWMALAALACVGVAGAAFVLRKRAPVAAWSLLWFAGPLAPVSVIASVFWPGFGRYLYLPAAGLAIGMGELAALAYAGVQARAPRVLGLFRVALVLWPLGLALALAQWTAEFRNEDTLYAATVQAAPERGHGWVYLGSLRAEQNRCIEAVPMLRRARTLVPVARELHPALAQCELALGERREALATVGFALRRFGPSPALRVLAASVLRAGGAPGDLARAREQLLLCLRESPGAEPCRRALDAP